MDWLERLIAQLHDLWGDVTATPLGILFVVVILLFLLLQIIQAWHRPRQRKSQSDLMDDLLKSLHDVIKLLGDNVEYNRRLNAVDVQTHTNYEVITGTQGLLKNFVATFPDLSGIFRGFEETARQLAEAGQRIGQEAVQAMTGLQMVSNAGFSRVEGGVGALQTDLHTYDARVGSLGEAVNQRMENLERDVNARFDDTNRKIDANGSSICAQFEPLLRTLHEIGAQITALASRQEQMAQDYAQDRAALQTLVTMFDGIITSINQLIVLTSAPPSQETKFPDPPSTIPLKGAPAHGESQTPKPD